MNHRGLAMGKTTLTDAHNAAIEIDFNALPPKEAYKFAKAFLKVGAVETAYQIVKEKVVEQGEQLRFTNSKHFHKLAKIYIATENGKASPQRALTLFNNMKGASKEEIRQKLSPLGKNTPEQQSPIPSNIAGLQQRHAAFTPPVRS